MDIEQLYFFADEIEKTGGISGAIKGLGAIGKLRSPVGIGGAITTAQATRTGAKAARTPGQIQRVQKYLSQRAKRLGGDAGASYGRMADVAKQHTPNRAVSPFTGQFRRGGKIDPSWENVNQLRAVANPVRNTGLMSKLPGAPAYKPGTLLDGRRISMAGSNPKINVAKGQFR